MMMIMVRMVVMTCKICRRHSKKQFNQKIGQNLLQFGLRGIWPFRNSKFSLIRTLIVLLYGPKVLVHWKLIAVPLENKK